MVCGSYSGGSTGLTGPFVRGERRGCVDGIHIIEFELDYSNELGFIQRVLVFLSFSLKSIKLVFTEKYDLLFATTTPLTAAIPGIVARWVRGKTFVFEVRDLWPELPREMGVITNPVILGLMQILEWAAYKSAQQLIALSPGIKSGIERLGIPESRICMIPNGCDLDIFAPSKVDAWQPEGVNERDFVAIFSGTHGPANGLHEVLKAAEVLKSRGRSDIKFVLIGQGKLKKELMVAAKEKALSNILFLDAVDKQKLSGLMKRANVGMQLLANVPAFYFGTSPNKFFDYIAAGLPVLNNYPGWLASIIEESECGVAVPPESAVLFADALEELASDRSALEVMGSNALALAKSRFDRDKLSNEFVDWLEAAAESKLGQRGCA